MNRLGERYGSPELIEAALKRKLETLFIFQVSFCQFVTMKEKLYIISDILTEIESSMEDVNLRDLLPYFNTSSGEIPIVSKLPPTLERKWTSRASKYKKMQSVVFPPFREFSVFIREQSIITSHTGFSYVPPEKNARKCKLDT